MAADLESLWPGVEQAAPDNPGPLLVAADWCDENDQPRLAYALRWCAGHEIRPYRRGDVVRVPWIWLREQVRYGHISRKEFERRGNCIIPACIFDREESDTCELAYKTSLFAYQALAMWLADVRFAIEIPNIPLPSPIVIPTGPVQCGGCGVIRSREHATCPVCKSTETA